MTGTNNFIVSFIHLKDRPNADHALDMLKRVASLVKPIMRKHGWLLPELCEFFPDNPNLLGLNVNMGEKILVRLRPAHTPDWFLEHEDVVQTMLHELTHNVHGPHDDKFYKFLSGLQEEYATLKRTGYAGEGFHSPGQRLGGNVSYNDPPHLKRLKAIEAAEKRKRLSRVLGTGNGVHRLGGPSTTTVRNLTPRELAAQAAERRMRDQKTCGSQQGSNLAEREAAKAAREGIRNNAVDLTMDDDLWEPDWISDPEPDSDSDDVVIVGVTQRPTANPSNSTSPPSTSSSAQKAPRPTGNTRNPPAFKSGPSRPASKPAVASKPMQWACQVCTLLNPASALECEACRMRRPLDDKVGWSCFACGETGMEHQFWTCRRCFTVKAQS